VDGKEEPNQNNVQQPYVQQPQYDANYRYQQPGFQGPPKKKSMAALWISIAAVVVVLAAVALFVWPGFITSIGDFGGGHKALLSGNTPQTKFVNETFFVLEDSFSDMGNDTISKVLEQPFDMTMDMSANMQGQKNDVKLDVAYDKQTLGLSAEVGGEAVKVLLLEDVLYAEANGQTYGIEFGSNAELKKDMSLKDRIEAIVKDISNSTGKTSAAKLDYKKLVETLVNSIDEKCIEKSGSKTTLTLTMDDIYNTLETFADKLDKDEALNDSLSAYIKEVSGQSMDIASLLKSSLSMLKSEIGSVDFKMEWTISYTGGKPTGMEIVVNAEGTNVDFSYGYEKKASGNEIAADLTVNGEKYFNADFSYDKKADGIDYQGTITAQGQSVGIKGNEDWKGDKTSGKMTLTNQGEEVSFEYDETLKIGMPSEKVKDNSKFDIDTSKVEKVKLSDIMMNPYALSNLYSTPAPTASVAPAASPEASAVYSSGLADLEGTLWSSEDTASAEGQALYFSGGKVYFGEAGMTGDELIAMSSACPYTFDGVFSIQVTGSDNKTVTYYYDGTYIYDEAMTAYSLQK
jgi:hypothetical protein